MSWRRLELYLDFLISGGHSSPEKAEVIRRQSRLWLAEAIKHRTPVGDAPEDLEPWSVLHDIENAFWVLLKPYDYHIDRRVGSSPSFEGEGSVREWLMAEDFTCCLERVNRNCSCDGTIHFLHQLDFATSGLLMVTRCRKVAKSLRPVMARDERNPAVFVKQYEALLSEGFAEGTPRNGWIISVIRKDPSKFKQVTTPPLITQEAPQSLSEGVAATRFRYIEDVYIGGGRTAARMEFQLLTGRRHQLRLHCSEGFGNAILGDMTYGGRHFWRMCLHASRVELKKKPDHIDCDWEGPIREFVVEMPSFFGHLTS